MVPQLEGVGVGLTVRLPTLTVTKSVLEQPAALVVSNRMVLAPKVVVLIVGFGVFAPETMMELGVAVH